jgi:hypothetical protein
VANVGFLQMLTSASWKLLVGWRTGIHALYHVVLFTVVCSTVLGVVGPSEFEVLVDSVSAHHHTDVSAAVEGVALDLMVDVANFLTVCPAF